MEAKTISPELNSAIATRHSAGFRISIAGGALLMAFATIILFVSLGDAIMSYVIPGFMQDNLQGSATLMGIIIATSSIVGALSDFFVGKWFRGKRFGFFLKWTLIIALSFPVVLILFPSTVLYFLVAMAIWGVYYELISFSISQFIVEYTKREDHANAWAIIIALKSLSYAVGPIIAQLLHDNDPKWAFYAAIGFILVAVVGYVFVQGSPRIRRHYELAKTRVVEQTTFRQEFRVWKTLSRVLWHMLLFTFLTSIVDAAFWTTGTVLSQQLTDRGAPPGILLLLYNIPFLFVGVFVGKVIKHLGGKKRTAFIMQFIASILLMFASLAISDWLLLLLIFISSVFAAISLPALSGAYTDYADRTPKAENELVGLEASVNSLAYIAGPIIAGVTSDIFGVQQSFMVFGIISAVVSIFALFVVPRKIRIPQQEIEGIIA